MVAQSSDGRPEGAGGGRELRGAASGHARSPRTAPSRVRTDDLAVHGAVGGFLGGLAMALLAMTVSASLGRGFFMPMRLVAAIAFGPDAMGGVVPIVVGILIHLAMATALGVLFAWAIGGFRPNLMAWSIAYAVLVWLLAQFFALPLANPIMAAQMPPLLWLLCHVAYGAVLGGYLAEGAGS